MQWRLFVQDRDLAEEWWWSSGNAWACCSGSAIMAARSYGQYVTCDHGLKYFSPLLWSSYLFETHRYTFCFNEETELAGVFVLNQLAGICLINAVTLQMHIIGLIFFSNLTEKHMLLKAKTQVWLEQQSSLLFLLWELFCVSGQHIPGRHAGHWQYYHYGNTRWHHHHSPCPRRRHLFCRNTFRSDGYCRRHRRTAGEISCLHV